MLHPGEHVAQSVDAYLHDLLKVEEAQAVEEHCAACPECGAALAAARLRADVFRGLPRATPSAELTQRVVRQVQRQRRAAWFSSRAAMLLVATAVAFVGAAQWHCVRMAPTPYDLVVLGQDEWLSGSEASLRVLVFDRRGGVPLAGVPVEVDLLETAQAGETHVLRLAALATDASGSAAPRFRVPDGTPDRQLRVQARLGGGVETVRRKIALKRAARVTLATDKPAYQPGQTLHLSATVRGPAGPLPGAEAVFSLVDAQGNRLFRGVGVASRFGVAAVDCPLVDSLGEGAYVAACTASGAAAAATVAVKRHKTPKIIVEAQLDQPFYNPQQPIKGVVIARHRSGAPVAGAQVMLQLETTEVVPRMVEDLAGRLDGQGRIGFQLPPKPDLFAESPDNPDVGCRLNVTVLDSAGDKGALSVVRPVTAQGLRLQAIPEGGTLVPGVVNRIYLLANYPDGRPARCRVAIDGEDRELATNEYGVALWEGTPEAPRLTWALRADDDHGQVGRRRIVLPCAEIPGDFLVRVDQAVCEPGATLTVSVASRDSAPVLIDLLHDGRTFSGAAVALTDGRGRLQCPLPAGITGALQVCAYRYGAEGLIRRKVRSVYVRSQGALRVEASPGDAVRQPGDRAMVRFRVTNQQGRPVAAELGLLAVDASAAAAVEARQGQLTAETGLDPSLDQPLKELQLWRSAALSPDQAKRRDLFALALFSRTAAEQPGLRQSLGALLHDRLETPDSLLKLLGRPDWEALLRRNHVPEKSLTALRGELHAHPLKASSYPPKAYQIELQRRALTAAVRRGWVVVAVLAAVVCGAALLHIRPLGCLLGVVGLVLAGYLLFRARPLTFDSLDDAPTIHAVRQLGAALDTAPANDERKSPAAATAAEVAAINEWLEQRPIWRPQTPTDDAGVATIEIPLPADGESQTLFCRALDATGGAGAVQAPLKVQPPVCSVEVEFPERIALGDIVQVRATVSNRAPSKQQVRAAISESAWSESLDPPAATLNLAPAEVAVLRWRIRSRKAGRQRLNVEVLSSQGPTTVGRTVEVTAPGKLVEQVQGGSLLTAAEAELRPAAGAVPGGVHAELTVYPTALARLVAEMNAVQSDRILALEQAIAGLYPPLLLLEAMHRVRLAAPELEATARERLICAFQRLGRFEVRGGGFDSFGRGSADILATALTLVALEDLAREYDVDPQRIARARDWLLAQQDADGVWGAAAAVVDDPAHPQHAQAVRTAFVAAAVFAGRPQHPTASRSLTWLRRLKPGEIRDPYLLALAANALRTLDPAGDSVRPWLDALERQARFSSDNSRAWWEQPAGYRPLFGRGDRNNRVETTALAFAALLTANRQTNCVAAARAWLLDEQDATTSHRDAPAQIYVWKALALADAGRPEMFAPQQLRLLLDKQPYRTLDISAAQASQPQTYDLSERFEHGARLLQLTPAAAPGARYRLLLRTHTAESPATPDAGPLRIHLACDRAKMAVHERTSVRVTIANQQPTTARLLFVELPIPSGCAAETEPLDIQVRSGLVAAYRLLPGRVLAALRDVEPEQPRRVEYVLLATAPAKTAPPVVRVYDYYAADKQAVASGEPLEITAKQ